jgi:hypothetical protein
MVREVAPMVSVDRLLTPTQADKAHVSNTDTLRKYMDLDQKGAVMAEYVWIDGTNGMRSKTKVS